MNLSEKVLSSGETNQSTVRRGTILNPNAAEFVPSSLRGVSPGTTSTSDAKSRFLGSGSLGKRVLSRSESSVSANSDKESQQYWRQQLPDDITPDFMVMGGDYPEGIGDLSVAGLSLHHGSKGNGFPVSLDSGYSLNKALEFSPCNNSDASVVASKVTYPLSSYEEELSPTSFLFMPAKPLAKQVSNTNHLQGNGGIKDNFGHGYPNVLASKNPFRENSVLNPLEFLASQFPGSSAESLAELYYSNYCDLHSTVEMLLELQVDGSLNRNPNPKSLSALSIRSLDFPALPSSKAIMSKYSGKDVPQIFNPFRSSDNGNMLLFKSGTSFPSRGSIDFASAVRKLASQDSNLWKYNQNGSADGSVDSSRLSNVVTSSYNSVPARNGYGDILQNQGSACALPVWLETGEAVANMYSELRGEARDHAHIRNAYFEQARQACLIGNKALAKELSVKGQMHNMHMKAAHTKACEFIYRQRNQGISELQDSDRWLEKMIDLHGLHVYEAIHVLKHELAVLRSIAWSSDQHCSVCIHVGTGHHTRGSCTPAILPIAVQRYLLKEEGLDYSELQPGMLRVVI